MKQVTWKIQIGNRTVSGCCESAEPLTIGEWTERISSVVARELDEGSYPISVDFGTIQEHKWTAVVTKQCQIIPF
jgi:hypothetical protein